VFLCLLVIIRKHIKYTKKSAKDISVQTYVVFGVETTTWFVYGIYTQDIILITGFALGVVGSWLVLGLSLFYRNK
jgi:uncharacterized protein with PQ loop repeat